MSCKSLFKIILTASQSLIYWSQHLYIYWLNIENYHRYWKEGFNYTYMDLKNIILKILAFFAFLLARKHLQNHTSVQSFLPQGGWRPIWSTLKFYKWFSVRNCYCYIYIGSKEMQAHTAHPTTHNEWWDMH